MFARTELARRPSEAAPMLLGAELTSVVDGASVTVRLTEVEAYGGVGEDPGSHAHRRRTARNATMFGEVGHLYVYFTYGMHWCLNVVAHEEGVAGAVLLRAGAVTAGVAAARARRPAARQDRDLARGPARLAAALGVDGSFDGLDLLDPSSTVRLDARPWPGQLAVPTPVGIGPRTGVAGAGSPTPWRFWLEGEPTVSPHRRAASKPG